MTNSVIGALRINLSADTAEFKRKLTEAERTAEKFGRAVGSTLRSGILAVAGAATAGAVALTALTKSSFETISAQVDLSKRVGASVAAIQTLQYQAELAGGSSEGLAKALGTLNARLGEAAREGAGPAYEAIQRLGLSISDLSNMDADERIKAIADAMDRLGYSTQQQASTLRDLGIRQQEIINLFQEGSKAIDDARAELQAWGVLLSDIDAAKVEAAGDAWDKLKMVLVGIGNQIAIRIAPLLQAISDYLSDAAKESGGFGDAIDKAITMGVRLFGFLNQSIYDFRINLDESIAEVLNLFDALAGAPANLLAKIFGGEAEDYGFKPVNESFGKLKDNLAKPPSDAEWVAWLDEIKKKSDEAAKIAAAAGRPGSGGDDDRISEAEVKEEEKYREKLQRRLVALQESLMTEREVVLAEYQKRLADLEEFHNAGIISDQEYSNQLVRSKQQYSEAIQKLDDEVTRNQMRNLQQQADGWFSVASDIGSALESIFGESKAIAIAQAIINTAQAITRSLAEYGATPLGLAAAAAAAAAGAAQIATITKTTKSSKGGGGNSVSSSAAAAAPASAGSSSSSGQAGAAQTLYISGISASSLYSGEAVRDLAQALVDFQRDGGKVVLGNT